MDITILWSPPTRRRGLKPYSIKGGWYLRKVASHAEAWIETSLARGYPPMASVASHAEAWIETRSVGL